MHIACFPSNVLRENFSCLNTLINCISIIQDDHNEELEEFSQSANHLHDINKNNKNNLVVAENGDRVNGNVQKDVVSDLIDLQLIKKVDDNDCDNERQSQNNDDKNNCS